MILKFVPLMYSTSIIVFINFDISETSPNLFNGIDFNTTSKISVGTFSVRPPSKYPSCIEFAVIPYFEFSKEYVLINY